MLKEASQARPKRVDATEKRAQRDYTCKNVPASRHRYRVSRKPLTRKGGKGLGVLGNQQKIVLEEKKKPTGPRGNGLMGRGKEEFGKC